MFRFPDHAGLDDSLLPAVLSCTAINDHGISGRSLQRMISLSSDWSVGEAREPCAATVVSDLQKRTREPDCGSCCSFHVWCRCRTSNEWRSRLSPCHAYYAYVDGADPKRHILALLRGRS